MEKYFKNKTPNFKKLISYGFVKNKDFYIFSQSIIDGEFKVIIKIYDNLNIKIETIESSTGEIYTLHLLEGVTGSFISKIKEEYNNILNNIAENCFEPDIFKSSTTKMLINYIENKYSNQPEYLWEKFPENAIFRRKDNRKWYAAILTVKRNRLGFDSDEVVEIVDLRASKEDVPNLIKKDNIYPGWHMNKKSWITIILDGSMDFNEICNFVDISFNLAKK